MWYVMYIGIYPQDNSRCPARSKYLPLDFIVCASIVSLYASLWECCRLFVCAWAKTTTARVWELWIGEYTCQWLALLAPSCDSNAYWIKITHFGRIYLKKARTYPLTTQKLITSVAVICCVERSCFNSVADVAGDSLVYFLFPDI